MHRFDEPTIPELPDLESSVTLLEADDPITPLPSLVVDHLLINSVTATGSAVTATHRPTR